MVGSSSADGAEIQPSIVDAILFQAVREPHKPAIGTSEGVVSYAQLAAGITAATVRCERVGLRPGAVVALQIANPSWHICLVAALYRLGIPSVAVGGNDAPLLGALGIGVAMHDGAPPGGYEGRTISVDAGWFAGEPSSVRIAETPFGENDLSALALSSGTTGRPKAIAFSPRILWHRQTMLSLTGRFAASERVYCGPQLRSQFGFVIAFAALAYGKMVCFASSAAESLSAISFFKVDLAMVSVHQLGQMVDVLGSRHGLAIDLREIQAGGASISESLLARARATLRSSIVSHYGSTEAGVVAFAPVEQLGSLLSDGAVGFVAPWASVEIRDEKGEALPPGREGQVRIRSLGIAPEYQPGMTEVVARAPFYPGDQGRLTRDGVLVIAGRTSEVLNLGGNKIAPDRVEEIILKCRGVKDAGVVVVEFNRTLPQVWAAVVSDGTADPAEITRRCGELSPLSTPAAVKIVDAIPRNSTGKILRDELRRQLTQGRV